MALNAKLGAEYSSSYSNSYSDSYAVEIAITDNLTGATTHIYRNITSSIEDILNVGTDVESSLEEALEQLRYTNKGSHTLEVLARMTPDGITVRQSLWGDQFWAVYEFTNVATGAMCEAEFDLDPAVDNSNELPAIAAEATAALS